MKLENNWHNKTLENLEKDYWGPPNYDSHLVKRCHQLRTIPLNAFTTEELRIMIGQNIGLNYLIPLALEVFTEDLFAEGDFYEGDLLNIVLNIETEFWDNNKPHWQTLNDLIKGRRDEIARLKFNVAKFDECRHRPISKK